MGAILFLYVLIGTIVFVSYMAHCSEKQITTTVKQDIFMIVLCGPLCWGIGSIVGVIWCICWVWEKLGEKKNDKDSKQKKAPEDAA